MKLLITFTLVFPLTFFAQKTDTTAAKKYFIGFTFSPDYCYRTLKSDSSTQFIVDFREKNEISKFGFTAGVNFKLNLSKRLSFETGLLLSDKGEKTKKSTTGGTPGPADPNQAIYYNFNYHYVYCDIPIKANYYFLTKKAKLFLTAGVSSNVFLFQNVATVLEYMDGHKERNASIDNSGFYPINLAVLAGLGFEYPLSEKAQLKIEPTFRHSFTSIIDAPIKGYLYSFGMNSGVYYKL